jgi:hypothetical protein
MKRQMKWYKRILVKKDVEERMKGKKKGELKKLEKKNAV